MFKNLGTVMQQEYVMKKKFFRKNKILALNIKMNKLFSLTKDTISLKLITEQK